MAGLHYEIVTPERLVRSGDAHMVVLPASEGEMGIMAHHAPVVTTLTPGRVTVHPSTGSATETIEITGGFAEMGKNGLTILADGVASQPGL